MATASGSFETRNIAADASAARGRRILLIVYLIATIFPLAFFIGEMRLTPLRLLLLVLFVPFSIKIALGHAGRVTLTDILMLCHALWIFLALMVVEGVEQLPFAGITVVELVGGYLVGRILIRSAEDFRKLVKYLLIVLIVLFPFALIEFFTSRPPILEFLGNFGEPFVRDRSARPRMGLERVHAVFDHPILFGMFCSLLIGSLYYTARGMGVLRHSGMIFATFMAFMSLSSGPVIACAIQYGAIVWDKITKGAWKLFFILAIIGYVVIDLLSDRTPITIFIETFTFNPGSGWTRINIFNYGMDNVWANPVFGLGFNDWVRPHWLVGSVDNFWLLTAMRYGIPACFLIIAAYIAHFAAIMRTPLVNEDARRLRIGYTITLGAACFTMVTVHVWGAVGVFVMFFLGAGAWLYTDENLTREDPDGDGPAEPENGRATRYTRFAPRSEPAAATLRSARRA